MTWLRRLLVGKPHRLETPELDERERQVDLNLARASGMTIEDVQRQTHQRSLQLRESYARATERLAGR